MAGSKQRGAPAVLSPAHGARLSDSWEWLAAVRGAAAGRGSRTGVRGVHGKSGRKTQRVDLIVAVKSFDTASLCIKSIMQYMRVASVCKACVYILVFLVCLYCNIHLLYIQGTASPITASTDPQCIAQDQLPAAYCSSCTHLVLTEWMPEISYSLADIGDGEFIMTLTWTPAATSGENFRLHVCTVCYMRVRQPYRWYPAGDIN